MNSLKGAVSNMKTFKLRSAFSMLELIFVIMILGIIASMASEMIVKVYEQYILQRAQHKASIKTELAATQIANRLASAIPGTVYRIRTGVGTPVLESIQSGMPVGSDGDDYDGIQWVGSDIESFTASNPPAWSGFCDVQDSNRTVLSTPGSNLADAQTITTNLSSTSGRAYAPVLYFAYDENETAVTFDDNDTIRLSVAESTIIEQYKLASSSYAIRVVNGDLRLYYDFDATRQASFANAPSSVLMNNISTFKFQAAGRTIRFKICRQENIGEDLNITVCKEKAVF